MEKEEYLKLVILILIGVLFLISFLSFKKIIQLEKEITNLQKEKQEISKQYQNCNKKFSEFINEYNQKPQQASEENRKNLTPREVVEKFLQADASGARMGGKIAKEAPSLKSYLGSGFSSAGEDFVMVIKNYEILEDYPSKDNKYHFVEVRYYCEEGVGSGSMGIPTEREILEGGFYIVPCPDFFKWLCPNCFKKSSSISSNMKFNFQKETQTVIFKLIRDKEEWKLDFPPVCPHIFEKTLEKHLESLQK